MSEIRLFQILPQSVEPILGSAVAVEKSLQTLVEGHLETLLGVRFLASEFATTKSHSGRIDTLGLDESNCPVIIEYKRAMNENVINQGLFYLDWLMDHRADFTLLAMSKLGADISNAIEWRAPRLICIAGEFTKYDQHAIQQMPRNIDLIRYHQYGKDLLLLEQIATRTVDDFPKPPKPPIGVEKAGKGFGDEPKHLAALQSLEQCSLEVRDWYEALRAFAFGLGDGIHEHVMEQYIAFRCVKNFAYVVFRPKLGKLVIDLALDDETAAAEAPFVQSGKYHWPRIEVDSPEDVTRAQRLIAENYRRV